MRTAALPAIALLLLVGPPAAAAAQHQGAPAHDAGKHPGPESPPTPDGGAHVSEAAAKPATSATPRPATASELDAVLARISKKIAARKPSAGAPRPQTPNGTAARKGAEPSRPRVELVWRPTVVWPPALQPVGLAGSTPGAGVQWPPSLAVSSANSR